MPRWIISPSAAADIEEAADYIASDDPTAAVHVVEDLLAAIELLAGRPGMGTDGTTFPTSRC